MCACGDLHPSYVCQRHLGTPDDWAYLFLPHPSEDQREDREQALSVIDFQSPFRDRA